MAKRAPTVVGLEIEPSAVHAAAVSVNGSITLTEAAVAPLDPGIVRDGEVQDVGALAEVLRDLFRRHRNLDKKVRLGVANQKIVVRVIELPPIEDPKELEAAIKYQAADQIPMPLDSAVLDYAPLGIVVRPDGTRRHRVVIVAARRDMVERLLLACRQAGLKPEGVDLSAFAMVRALHHDTGLPAADGLGVEPVLYLSIGGLTNLAVAEGPVCLFTRVVGGSLEAIAVELAERRALSLEHARAWLTHVGLVADLLTLDAGGEDDVAAEARAVLLDGVRRIGGEVRNSLDFHHAQDGMSLHVQRAVLTGAAATVPGFADALAAELGMPVATGAIAGDTASLDPHLLTVAAGLAVEEAPAA